MLLIFLGGVWGGHLLYNKFISPEAQNQASANAMLEQKVPEFTLPDLEGKVRNIREWDGEVIVLNFWATWWGLQFVGVAIDEINKVKDFMDTYGVTYPMLIGADDAVSIAKQYGNRFGALPYTVIIDRNGRIAAIQRGELTRERALETIKSLL